MNNEMTYKKPSPTSIPGEIRPNAELKFKFKGSHHMAQALQKAINHTLSKGEHDDSNVSC